MLNVKKKNKKENGVKSRLKEAKKMEAGKQSLTLIFMLTKD